MEDSKNNKSRNYKLITLGTIGVANPHMFDPIISIANEIPIVGLPDNFKVTDENFGLDLATEKSMDVSALIEYRNPGYNLYDIKSNRAQRRKAERDAAKLANKLSKNKYNKS